MSVNRQHLADAIRQLKQLAPWGHYVTTLEEQYNDRVRALLLSDHPDEALRGECRALFNMLSNINTNSGNLT